MTFHHLASLIVWG